MMPQKPSQDLSQLQQVSRRPLRDLSQLHMVRRGPWQDFKQLHMVPKGPVKDLSRLHMVPRGPFRDPSQSPVATAGKCGSAARTEALTSCPGLQTNTTGTCPRRCVGGDDSNPCSSAFPCCVSVACATFMQEKGAG